MLRATAKLIASDLEIRTKVMQAIAIQANRRFRQRGGGRYLKEETQRVLRKHLEQSRVVQDILSGGSLVGELGLTDMSGAHASDPAPRIQGLLDKITNSINVGLLPFTATGDQIVGQVQIWGIPYDHQDILNTDEAQQLNLDENGNLSNPPFLPWLEWLLTYGAQVIVTGFYVWKEIPTGAKLVRSRTGVAVMGEKKGEGWKIPAAYQGELGNNFITQSVDEMMKKDIPKLLKQKVF